MSTVIVSPSWIAAIGPPLAASGATWPIIRPRVAPEKRPSVTIATRLPQPLADDRRGDLEHLAHAGAADRALVADHDDVAGIDLLVLDRAEALLFGLEDPRRAGLLRCARCRPA